MCSILRKSFRSTLFASSRNSDLTEMKLQLLNSSIEVTYWTHRHYTNYFSLPLTLSFLLLEAKPGIGQIHLFVALKFSLAQPFPNRFIKSQWKMIWDAMKRYNRSEMRERRWRARHWENTVAPGQSEVVGVVWCIRGEGTQQCGGCCTGCFSGGVLLALLSEAAVRSNLSCFLLRRWTKRCKSAKTKSPQQQQEKKYATSSSLGCKLQRD